MPVPKHIKVAMIVLNNNLDPTGRYKIFKSKTKAGVAICQKPSTINAILDPTNPQTTTINKITGMTVTFVHADATKEEILELLKEIKKRQPISVTMLVLDENLKPTGEYEDFESQTEAGKTINQPPNRISDILNPDRSQKTVTDKRTGNTVTFVRANATEEEEKEWLFQVENKEKQPVKVTMIVLGENLKPTGESRDFVSQGEAGIAINQSQYAISNILNPKISNKTIKDRITGNTVTFVRADATEEEILEWLKEIENKQNKPIKTRVVYVASGKVENFDSMEEVTEATGVSRQTIKRDIEGEFKNLRKRYNRYTNEKIEFYKA